MLLSLSLFLKCLKFTIFVIRIELSIMLVMQIKFNYFDDMHEKSIRNGEELNSTMDGINEVQVEGNCVMKLRKRIHYGLLFGNTRGEKMEEAIMNCEVEEKKRLTHFCNIRFLGFILKFQYPLFADDNCEREENKVFSMPALILSHEHIVFALCRIFQANSHAYVTFEYLAIRRIDMTPNHCAIVFHIMTSLRIAFSL